MQKTNVVEVENVKVEESLIVSTAFIEFTDNELTDKTPETMIFSRFVSKTLKFDVRNKIYRATFCRNSIKLLEKKSRKDSMAHFIQ